MLEKIGSGKAFLFPIIFLTIFFILSFAPSEGWSQSLDFFTNTQSVDLLATGASGCPPASTCSANGPGFNTMDLILHSGTDPDGAGPISFTLFVNGVDVTGTQIAPHFSRGGPGAITDNAFVVIADPGADPVVCGTVVGLTAGGLNCGSLKFDPASQGITPPTLPVTDNLISNINDPPEEADFFPSSSDFTGIELDNRFIFSRTTAPITIGDLTVTCVVADFACIASKEREHQVTALVAGANGTLAAPGTGDQVFTLTNEFSTTMSSGTTFTPPTVIWSLTFNDPIRDDVGNPRMQANASGTFLSNTGAFPSVSITLFRDSTALCRGVAGTEGTCITVPF